MEPILKPEHEAVRSTFSAFIPAFAERAQENDRVGSFPTKNFAELHDAGLFGLLLPEQLGGQGLSYLAFATAIEQIARGCPSTGLCLAMHYSASSLVSAGAPEQQRAFADGILARGEFWTIGFSEPGSGSHFLNPQCKARRVDGGYALDGIKSFVTSASAAHYILMNAVLEGAPDGAFTLFAVPAKKVPGLAFEGAWDSMGMRANDSRSIRLTGCVVPQECRIGAENQGLQTMRLRPPFVDLGLSADSIGIAQAAMDLAVNHAKTRLIEGDSVPLSGYQAVRFMLADIEFAVNSARLMVQRAAWLAENSPKEAALAMTGAKCVANECAAQVSNKALQVIGGRGYMKGHPIERLVRDARAGSLMAFTTEQARDMIGKALLGLDPLR